MSDINNYLAQQFVNNIAKKRQEQRLSMQVRVNINQATQLMQNFINLVKVKHLTQNSYDKFKQDLNYTKIYLNYNLDQLRNIPQYQAIYLDGLQVLNKLNNYLLPMQKYKTVSEFLQSTKIN